MQELNTFPAGGPAMIVKQQQIFKKKYFLETLHNCIWNFPETPRKSKKLSWDKLETSCKKIWKLLRYNLNCIIFCTLDAPFKYFRNLLKRKEERKKKKERFLVSKFSLVSFQFWSSVFSLKRLSIFEDTLPLKINFHQRSVCS